MQKKFVQETLIPGEEIKYDYLSRETSYSNLAASLILFIATGSSALGFFEIRAIEWLILSIIFLLASSVYSMRVIESDYVVVTNFRVMEVHQSLFNKLFYGGNQLRNFEDLHYEHLESVRIGTPELKPIQFYGGVIFLSIGVIINGLVSEGIVEVTNATPFQIISIIFILLGIINLILSLPSGKPSVSLTSTSGWVMRLPQSGADEELVRTIVTESRSFISYGAIS